ncbi:MAG TPA: hypothetical protein VNJ08_14820 [Bacteriovoracaceae bacterium]|nr:hypothetical protein [Bacteriovoracaceae bacterium]
MNAPYREAVKKNFKNDFWLSVKQGFRSWYVYFFQFPVFPEMALKRGNLKSIEKMFFDQVHEHKLLTQYDMEVYKKALRQPGAMEAALNYYRANARDWLKSPEKKIEVPALLIWGEHDMALEKDLTNDMEEFFPEGLTKRFYPHSSHWVHLEYPREIQNEIVYFFSLTRLNRHKSGVSPMISL